MLKFAKFVLPSHAPYLMLENNDHFTIVISKDLILTHRRIQRMQVTLKVKLQLSSSVYSHWLHIINLFGPKQEQNCLGKVYII